MLRVFVLNPARRVMGLPQNILPYVSLNGAIMGRSEAIISPLDRGFQMADGIFETFYVTGGVLIERTRHLQRLTRSAAYMRLNGIPEHAVLARQMSALIERNELHGAEAALRLTVSRGTSREGAPTLFMHMRGLSAGHLRKRSDGVLGFRLPFTRHGAAQDLANHKTLAYLASSLGQILLTERTSDPRAEGFFVDSGGNVLEGTGSNLFIVEGDRVVTPPVAAGLLPGTSRAVVMELAPGLGLTVAEEPIHRDRLVAADEAFITSSTLRVAPLISLDDHTVGHGQLGAVTRTLQSAFQARIDTLVAAGQLSADG